MEGICSEKTNKSCETAWGHPGWLSNAPKTLPSAEIKVLRRDWNPPHSSMGGSRGCQPKAELTGPSPAEEKKMFPAHDLFLWVLPGTPHLSFHMKVLPVSRLSALPAHPGNGSDVCALPCTAQPFLGYHSTYHQSEQCPMSMLEVQHAQRWPDPTEKVPLLSRPWTGTNSPSLLVEGNRPSQEGSGVPSPAC